jgi:hypothetical protein
MSDDILPAINAHNPGIRGSALVQHLFRSPALTQLWNLGGQASMPRRRAKKPLCNIMRKYHMA